MIMTIFGGNRGYVGYSMSKRALAARAEGKFPKTYFKKEYGMSERVFKTLLSIHAICTCEWHHTSMYGNVTRFYEWYDEEVMMSWQEHWDEVKRLARKMKSSPVMRDYPLTRQGMDDWAHDNGEVVAHNEEITNKIVELLYGDE